MIIWINGAFGAGKTQTAFELHRRIPHSYVYDPENAGYFMRKNLPKESMKGDFQDYPIWRESNYLMLKYISETYDGIVITPMTVVSPQYFDDIIGRLRRDGIDVRHFALCASKEVLLKRLKGRGDGNRSWPAEQIDRCLSGLADETFRHHLDTDHMTIGQAAETMACMSNIRLQPDRRSGLRKSYDRLVTQLKHIRFFGG
ncbi:AAA family ATPase [Paenibacillus tarimensis]